MTITPLPTPPSRSDNPTTFRTDADAFLGALPTFVTEANALAVDVGNDATAASSAAGNALTYAGQASGYADAAGISASAASDSAGVASSEASDAGASAASAGVSAANAEASLSSFRAVYLGEAASDPTTDLNGDPLDGGEVYWNTTDEAPKIYSGGAWRTAVLDPSGALVAVNNLSDLGDPAAARNNLGLAFGATAALASQAEAEAGVDNTKIVTPLRVSQAIDALVLNASDYQEFTSSGTWVKPSGVTFVYVEMIAGGGGGANNTGDAEAGGGSGGEGGQRIFQASDLGPTEPVTVGAGGAGAANGSTANGSVGGATSFAGVLVFGGNPGTVFAGTFAAPPNAHDATAPVGTPGSSLNFSHLFFPQAGYGGGGDSTQSLQGGRSFYGGAGGGGVIGGIRGDGGTTYGIGGNGGDGKSGSSVPGGNGAAPGGGGGGSSNDGGGGDGGDGVVRIWSW